MFFNNLFYIIFVMYFTKDLPAIFHCDDTCGSTEFINYPCNTFSIPGEFIDQVDGTHAPEQQVSGEYFLISSVFRKIPAGARIPVCCQYSFHRPPVYSAWYQ